MTLEQFIIRTTGVRVGDGECGALVNLYLVDVFGNHTSYDTALEYWQNGIPGFVKVSSPQPGDIACYNAHTGFPDGHIGIYNGGGQVFEQNADPDGSPAHLYPRANTYLLGYLREEISMGVTVQGAPSAISWSEGRLDVFARGSDNNLWHKWWDGSWQPWEQVGTSIFSDPAVASWGIGRLDIFGSGLKGDLIHFYYDNTGYHGPESLGTPS